MKNKQIIGIVVAGVVFIAVCVTGVFSNVVSNKILAETKTGSNEKLLNTLMSSSILQDSIQ